ncbi:wnk kinase isoform m [Anaeramoeba flamelloides]|uniref:Wnk kinase isoform m n=1 Tax=Anaeramoeba flamelloides TaxID=1746091 RepID=A0AAV7YKD0_9EUKA|nr:wnk kinase isoform m [Anaeramoeba flamelloides]
MSIKETKNNFAHDPYLRYSDIVRESSTKRTFTGLDQETGTEIFWNDLYYSNKSLNKKIEKKSIGSQLKLCSSLSSKYIVKVLDFWEETENENEIENGEQNEDNSNQIENSNENSTETPEIVFSYITNSSNRVILREHLKKFPSLHENLLRKWSSQLLQALFYLHNHSNGPIIHRAISLDNIYVDPKKATIKLSEIGIINFGDQEILTHWILNPSWISPEFFDGTYNEKIDIYSFGMCLLELATNEIPYSECKNSGQILKHILTQKPPKSLSKIKNNDVARIVKQCLKSASERPSAGQLLEDEFFINTPKNSIISPRSDPKTPSPKEENKPKNFENEKKIEIEKPKKLKKKKSYKEKKSKKKSKKKHKNENEKKNNKNGNEDKRESENENDNENENENVIKLRLHIEINGKQKLIRTKFICGKDNPIKLAKEILETFQLNETPDKLAEEIKTQVENELNEDKQEKEAKTKNKPLKKKKSSSKLTEIKKKLRKKSFEKKKNTTINNSKKTKNIINNNGNETKPNININMNNNSNLTSNDSNNSANNNNRNNTTDNNSINTTSTTTTTINNNNSTNNSSHKESNLISFSDEEKTDLQQIKNENIPNTMNNSTQNLLNKKQNQQSEQENENENKSVKQELQPLIPDFTTFPTNVNKNVPIENPILGKVSIDDFLNVMNYSPNKISQNQNKTITNPEIKNIEIEISNAETLFDSRIQEIEKRHLDEIKKIKLTFKIEKKKLSDQRELKISQLQNKLEELFKKQKEEQKQKKIKLINFNQENETIPNKKEDPIGNTKSFGGLSLDQLSELYGNSITKNDENNDNKEK